MDVLWESTPIATAQIKYTDYVYSNTENQFKLQVMSFEVCKYTLFKKRMLELIKKATRCQELDVVSYSLINLRVISVISTFNSSPECTECTI